jgi:hypothetical protein
MRDQDTLQDDFNPQAVDKTRFLFSAPDMARKELQADETAPFPAKAQAALALAQAASYIYNITNQVAYMQNERGKIFNQFQISQVPPERDAFCYLPYDHDNFKDIGAA